MLLKSQEGGKRVRINLLIGYRVPMPPGKSWIFFFKIPGPGKSWKITLVLEIEV